jgi:hypothetical protein
MTDDGKSVVSSLKSLVIFSAISWNEMNKRLGANCEVLFVKGLSILIWRKNSFQGQWVVESIIVK